MKKFIIVIISIMLLCGCARVSDVSQQVSIETTSEVSGTYSSEPISSDISSQATSIVTSTLSSNVSSKSIDISSLSYEELEDYLKTKGKFFSIFHQHDDDEIILNDEIADIVEELIIGNTYLCSYYFYLRAYAEDSTVKVNENLYKYNSNDSLNFIKEQIQSVYSANEANLLINEPYYGIKRYHYFEENGECFLDKTVANQTSEKPINVYSIRWFSFNYEIVDETHMNIDVFVVKDFGSEDGNIYTYPLTAVLEDGKWKLEKMVFDESVVLAK